MSRLYTAHFDHLELDAELPRRGGHVPHHEIVATFREPEHSEA